MRFMKKIAADSSFNEHDLIPKDSWPSYLSSFKVTKVLSLTSPEHIIYLVKQQRIKYIFTRERYLM